MDNLEGLVRKLKSHGPDADLAFQELYEATSRTALAVIRRYCDLTEDYEDLLQETYIRVYRSIDSLKDDTKALAWIRRIAGNTAIRHNMKQRPQMFSDMEDEDGNVPDFEDMSGAYDPSKVVDQKAVSQAVTQVLDSLPLDQRTALWRVYGQQMTIREVAAELEISENTIKSRLYQGRNKLLARKEEFRRLGVELTAVPIAILIAVAFEDTVYAAPLAAGTAAGAAAAAAQAAKRTEKTAAQAARKSGEIASQTANEAGKAASQAIHAGSKAVKGAGFFGKLTIGAKAAIAAGAVAVVIGGAGTASVLVSHASPYLAPIEVKLKAYNDRAYGLKSTLETYYPDEVLESVEDVLKSGTSPLDGMYLEYWKDEKTYIDVLTQENIISYNDQFGEDWKLSWKKTGARKLSEDELEELRDQYESYPLDADPNVQLEVILADHIEEYEKVAENLRDMEITEGYLVTLDLHIKGKEGKAQEEKQAVVVKQGGDWVLCDTNPNDLVYKIEFSEPEEAAGEKEVSVEPEEFGMVTEEDTSMAGDISGEVDSSVNADADGAGNGTEHANSRVVPEIDSVILDDLNLDAGLFGDTFLKAWDPISRLSFYPFPGEGENISEQNELCVSFYRRKISEQGEDLSYAAGNGSFQTRPGVTSYEVVFHMIEDQGDQDEEWDCPMTVSFVPIESSGSFYISLEGDGLAAGEYYSLERDYDFVRGRTDVLVRQFCKADLAGYTTEELRLLRNSIYAAYGRKFQSEDLNQYFSDKIWYRPLLGTDAFSDNLLTDIERKNAAFIKEMEDMPEDERNRLDGSAYEFDQLEDAPYLSYLDQYPETGVFVDTTQAVDMGAWWKMPGIIYHPVYLTEEEYAELQQNGSIKVCTDDLTGEWEYLETREDGRFVMHAPDEEVSPDPNDYTWDTSVYFDASVGLYYMTQESEDTVMKPVYEGDIYVLKEAVFGSHVSYELACQNQRRILLDDREWGNPWDGISANFPYHNGKGYFTALYSLGD